MARKLKKLPTNFVVRRKRLQKAVVNSTSKKGANQQRRIFRRSGLKTTTYHKRNGSFRVYGYR